MSRSRHYVPVISRPVVCALYHEAKRRRIPMTRLLEELLTTALQGSVAWQLAHPTSTPTNAPSRGH
jgi:hypothetical protein